MTTTTITHTCKHSVAHDLSSKSEDARESFVKWLIKNKCPDCRSKAWKKSRDNERVRELRAQYQEALNASAVMGLTDLKGSDAQVMWGTIARLALLRSAYEVLVGDKSMTKDEFRSDVLVPARRQWHAGFWMDQRSKDVFGLPAALQNGLPPEA